MKHKDIRVKSLDHLAIAVRRIKDHLPLYRDALGMRLEGIYPFKAYGVRIASLKLINARLELIEPAGRNSTLNKFLEKRGEGLHHVAFQVRDLRECVAALKAEGRQWINERPRTGLHHSRICFLHPSSAKGILLEFVARLAL